MDEGSEAPQEYVDHVALVQSVMADLDPTALCTGFVAVVEWIEEDGSPSISMIHSPMPPWHLQGMLGHAQKYHDYPVIVVDPEVYEGEWEEEG